MYTAQKVPKYGANSGPCFPVYGLSAGKYEPEITPYLHTFHAVRVLARIQYDQFMWYPFIS